MSIKDFRQSVISNANSKSDEPFENKGASHAAIVLGNIFRTSTDYVYIYSGKLNSDVTKITDFSEEIPGLFERKVKIKVLLDELPLADEQSDILKELISKKDGINIDVRLMPEETKKEKPDHFAIADDRMIRLEIDAEEYKALCSFNVPEIVGTFKKFFEQTFSKSTEV